MKYRIDSKSQNKLSLLGFGCMRLPRSTEKTEALILNAVNAGVNYFDCAYIYPGSEETLGAILEKHNLRSKVYIATKLPLMNCKAYEDFDRLFDIQLGRLKTTYIDYYLMHALGELDEWKRLCGLGIEKWIREKKQSGQLGQLGFSFHGKHAEFMELVDAYAWDFCQIQYNYININYQAGRAGLLKAHEKGIPVMIMEPLLGGKLATGLPEKAVKIFAKQDASRTPAAWAFRWLYNHEQVTMVLSGMNHQAQLDENVALADSAMPNMIDAAENSIYEEVIKCFNESYKIPCTGCNYCMPCPKGVNIPACFSAYNTYYSISKISAVTQYILSTGGTSFPRKYAASQCGQCGQCEKRCPQNIRISSEMGRVKRRLESGWLIFLSGIVMKFIQKRD